MKNIVLLLVFMPIIVHVNVGCMPDSAAIAKADELLPTAPRLANLLGADELDDYASVREPRRFNFPADHGPHPEYRNEWWYVTGNLDSEDARRFGFELTIFRFALTPGAVPSESAWRSNQVYIGHFAITDRAADEFHVAQRYSRGGAGLAGAQSEPFRIWLEDWELIETQAGTDADGNSIRAWNLRARDTEIEIDLTLTAKKPPVLNGHDGLSQKSSTPGNASYYYSIPRLHTTGTLRSGTESYRVNGLSWLDREWGSGGLSNEQQGWDWFALQLSDGSDLMFYDLRRKDGTQDKHSAGTYIAVNGTSTRLTRDDVRIDVIEHWDSPNGARYPILWQIEVESLDLKLRLTPIMAGQELATLVRYWEGAVDVEGSFGEGNDGDDTTPITGRGYVELTGYAEATALISSD